MAQHVVQFPVPIHKLGLRIINKFNKFCKAHTFSRLERPDIGIMPIFSYDMPAIHLFKQRQIVRVYELVSVCWNKSLKWVSNEQKLVVSAESVNNLLRRVLVQISKKSQAAIMHVRGLNTPWVSGVTIHNHEHSFPVGASHFRNVTIE